MRVLPVQIFRSEESLDVSTLEQTAFHLGLIFPDHCNLLTGNEMVVALVVEYVTGPCINREMSCGPWSELRGWSLVS